MKFNFRRKQYFVDRGFQLRFARFVMFFMLSACAVTGLTVFYSTFSVLSERLVGIYPQARLVGIFRSAYIALGIGMLMALPVIFFVSLVFSHRVAGPLPKIYRALRDIGAGNFDVHLTLRDKDELKELVEMINTMAARLKERETKK